MTSFLTLSAAAATTCLDVLGEAITYTESGGSAKTIRAIIDFDVEERNELGELVGRYIAVNVAKADITNAVGATVVIRGTTYTVKVPNARVPISHDGVRARLLVQ